MSSRAVARLRKPYASTLSRTGGRDGRLARALAGACRLAQIEGLEPRLLLSTIYVDDVAPAANNGSSWANAYVSLQSALAVAQTADVIEVGQGTYTPTTTTDRTASFFLKSGVAIYGGYAGYGSPNPDARNVAVYATTLSGDIGAVGDASDNSYHVVIADNLDSGAVLDGFTVTGGNADVWSTSATSLPLWPYGGGMLTLSSNPMLANCTFRDNTAVGDDGSGGGMEIEGSSPTLTNCDFIANTGNGGSGGVDVDTGNETGTQLVSLDQRISTCRASLD